MDAVLRIASVTKLLTAYAALVAVEEGTIALDDPVGQPGATVRHLLAHAGGYGFDGQAPILAPGRRRIYSNTGIELLAAHVEARAAPPLPDLPRRGRARSARHVARRRWRVRPLTSCAAR